MLVKTFAAAVQERKSAGGTGRILQNKNRPKPKGLRR